MSNCRSMRENSFSPWVFVTYACTCNCPYCMVPKVKGNSMTPETFEKMLFITEKVLEKGDYDSAHFRLSGGEPLLAFDTYKDLIPKYKNKHKGKMGFGFLTNLTVLTDEMIEWMQRNQISGQVSLDCLINSKPLNDGTSSSEVVLKNIQRLREARIGFSLNTVYNYENTKSLRSLVDYVCSVNPSQWGFSASFTLNDDSNYDETIDQIKLAILRLKENGFDLRNKFRFYNEMVAFPGKTCSAGVNIFALGTNLELWSCQAMIDKPPLGYFDENFNELLKTCEGNKYFYDRTMLPRCTDCNVLNWCRGGCRAVHQSDMKAVEVTCRFKQDIIPFLNYMTMGDNGSAQLQNNNCACMQPGCKCDETANGIDKLFDDYINNTDEHVLVDTPDLSVFEDASHGV